MQKHLYFICPTDHLEPIINSTFKQENYYFTSLGNSIVFDTNMVSQLKELLQTKNIQDISFVLSDNNRIVSDALGKQAFSGITGLSNFYNQITRQRENSEEVWQTYNHQFLILSHHLNDKIKELKLCLKQLSVDPPKINGKIYNRHQEVFSDIYSDLICGAYVQVN
ncbi:hypothetical protein QQ020_14200 [Fulvivirgaceae bacterium BMA12]|uniref:Uncharacterized protein n=1 Tax=Agaribacillus aureus TaxID=3051825 RepID=A0ABT8LA04_9BACT|nr:hypothetical protein [Fulvivirgaceae bacterium BMA12]